MERTCLGETVAMSEIGWVKVSKAKRLVCDCLRFEKVLNTG